MGDAGGAAEFREFVGYFGGLAACRLDAPGGVGEDVGACGGTQGCAAVFEQGAQGGEKGLAFWAVGFGGDDADEAVFPVDGGPLEGGDVSQALATEEEAYAEHVGPLAWKFLEHAGDVCLCEGDAAAFAFAGAFPGGDAGTAEGVAGDDSFRYGAVKHGGDVSEAAFYGGGGDFIEGCADVVFCVGGADGIETGGSGCG